MILNYKTYRMKINSTWYGSGEWVTPSHFFFLFLKLKLKRHERDSVNADNVAIKNMGQSSALNCMLFSAGGPGGTYLLINTTRPNKNKMITLKLLLFEHLLNLQRKIKKPKVNNEIEEIFVLNIKYVYKLSIKVPTVCLLA